MEVRIELTYKTPKGAETFFTSEEMKVAKALLIAEDIEKTGRVKQLAFIDHVENTWTMKEMKKFLKGIETEPHDITIYFDGGFDKYSNKSGLGCVIYYEQNGKSWRLRKNALVEELETNNEAEYAALYLAIQELELLGAHHIPVSIIGDSQVVINQLSEDWPVYEEDLLKWIERVEKKLEELGLTASYKQVPRTKNKEADQLASQALNGIEITGTMEIQH
ncbi:ribonuclease H family protein [Radiobacillus kanasensis]|uniref:ribonuclease H family protein n=1 Tax=Radiobacillus kanasensis TaxID=2844358 RepID=UPI001E442DF3|nr:ribonuclease H family protein [Radiobacillus kanasensis]UFU01347.1 ribonuclease H family protein [Radiobacillus kanasensis]